MSRELTSRRQFLTAAGGLITLSLGSAELTFSAEESARIDAAGLMPDELLTLVRILQHILPHDRLDAQVYHDAVLSFTDQIGADTGKRRMIRYGIAALNAPPYKWLDLAFEDQRSALEAIEDSAFFKTMRTTALERIYRDERTWQLIGYEGDASRFGGYLKRGFDDIDWLTDSSETGE